MSQLSSDFCLSTFVKLTPASTRWGVDCIQRANMLIRRALLLPGAAVRSSTPRSFSTRAFAASQTAAASPWQSGARDGSVAARRGRALRGAGQVRAMAFGAEAPASVVDEGTKVTMGGTMEKTRAAIRKQVLLSHGEG